MAKGFEPGTVVQLKSGGPEMTVEKDAYDPGEVWCQWFGGRKLERGHFPIVSLVVVKPEKKNEK